MQGLSAIPQQTKIRNHSLDMLKAVSMVLVVFIHAKFPGSFGLCMVDIARLGVPIFFMISGIYLYRTDFSTCVKRCKKTAILLAASVSLYVAYAVLTGGVRSFLDQVTLAKVAKLLFLNKSIVAEHLWYLYALLYCYLIFTVLIAKGYLDRLSKIISGLLVLTYLLVEILPALFHRDPMNLLGRNAWLLGMPFMMIGYCLEKKKYRMNGISCVILVALGCVMSIGERLLFFPGDLYIGTAIASIALVMYAVNHPGKPNILSKIGKRYSAVVYILHPLIITLLRKLLTFAKFEFGVLIEFFIPISVLILSLFLAVCYDAIYSAVKKRCVHVSKK